MNKLDEITTERMMEKLVRESRILFDAEAESIIEDLIYSVDDKSSTDPLSYHIGYAEAQLDALYDSVSKEFDIDEKLDFYLSIFEIIKELDQCRTKLKALEMLKHRDESVWMTL